MEFIIRTLITAFEPFEGRAQNASELALALIRSNPRQFNLDSARLHFVVLPVDRHAGPQALLAALEYLQPQVVICTGQSTNRPHVSVERIAVNLADYRIADNGERQPMDEPVVANGPAAYFSTLPTRAIRDEIHAAGIRVQLSQDAGTFVCNTVFYAALHFAAKRGFPLRAGFLHVPCAETKQDERIPTLPTPVSAQAIALAARVAAA